MKNKKSLLEKLKINGYSAYFLKDEFGIQAFYLITFKHDKYQCLNFVENLFEALFFKLFNF